MADITCAATGWIPPNAPAKVTKRESERPTYKRSRGHETCDISGTFVRMLLAKVPVNEKVPVFVPMEMYVDGALRSAFL